jgi:nucleoside-diphosphate-sugar epimerase
MTNRFFVFGLGFSGREIARQLLEHGWQVAGTTRSGEAMDLPGVTVHAFDRDHPLPESALEGTTALLSAVPPDGDGDPVTDRMGAAIAALPGLRWAGYLSTTGIYGDHGGGWVDEDTPPAPTLERARRRIQAEDSWQALGLPLRIFRLAGIYGPGRSAIDTVRQGNARRIVKPGQVFSRIHVEDIAAAVLASLERPTATGVFNLCDDDPAPPQDVIAHACALLRVTPPPEIPWEHAAATLSPMALSFYSDNKLVSNIRIKRDLGLSLRYPSYRDGLRAILEQKS